MATTTFDGITQRTVRTPRLAASVLERESATAAKVVVFVHGNVSSSLFWQPTMLALPAEVRAIAVDLRGFGDSETLPVDATRGLRDFADDVASVLDELGVASSNVVGWSMGAGVVMQLLLDRPDLVSTLNPGRPGVSVRFRRDGWGGRSDADGRRRRNRRRGSEPRLRGEARSRGHL